LEILVYAGLVVSTVAAYQPVRHNGFVNYDDDVYVTDNVNIRKGLTKESFVWAFTATYAGNWHPLTWISHILDYQFFGTNPLGHHLTSVLLHIANTLLLFYILRRMTGATWRSAFVAAVFALHPLHVESAAWVAERKDVLAGLFWLLTMLAYVRYAEGPSVIRYLISVIVFAFGLMAKPMLVTLPFVLLLLDYWPLNRFLNSKFSILNLVLEKVPFLALSVISSIVTFIAQSAGGSVTETQILPLGARMSNALVSYIGYTGKMIYPAGLAVLYPHPQGGLPAWQVISAAILLVLITMLVILARQRRYLAVGWLWYLVTLVPVIGLVQVGVQAMADRYTYLPSIGISIMVAWFAGDILQRQRIGRIISGTVSLLAISVLLVCTNIQVRYWHDSVTLFERALAVTKNNYRMHHSLAFEMISQGRLDDGISHYRTALQITPGNAEIHYNLANALRRQGKISEAIEEYRLAAQYKSDYADAHNNLGYALLSQGNFDEAMQHFGQALRLRPDWPYAMTGLAQALATYPNPDMRDVELAVEFAERAVALTDTRNATILDTLAVAYAAAGRFDDAVTTEQAALEVTSVENDTRLAATIQKHLELFRNKRAISATPSGEPEHSPGPQRQWAQPIELPGVPNFHKVSDNLYRGAQPTEEGMKELKKLGIKTIINLRSFHSDRNEIGDTGLDNEHIYMQPWRSENEDVVRFLQIVTDPNKTPVFVHCQRGADRTGTMCAIYRIAVQDWPKDEAIKEMTEGDFGFFEGWQNLIDYIRNLDIEKIKQQAGIEN